ncbi:MAG: S-methyl-5-thioribose-1-phosphate isomerase [Gemmatimonadaceae bacterium]
MTTIEAVCWSPAGDALRIIDQTLLPELFVERDLSSLEEICGAIASLAVRGAPAIGIAGAIGLVTSLLPHAALDSAQFSYTLRMHAERIRRVRPTAANLSWAVARMLACTSDADDNAVRLDRLRREATAILDEDRLMCRRIGMNGLSLVPNGSRVLTHCNAGALATGGIGTALAPIYLAAEEGRDVRVFVTETRPLLQGSRLTAWELTRAAVPVTVIADNAVASVMSDGAVDIVIVGADRIAANGDLANKIGTYGIAVLARQHGIPLYVAAPASTFDRRIGSGQDIPIEQRDRDEIARWGGRTTVPEAAHILNPAFDITPAELVTGIISDLALHSPPYDFRGVFPQDGVAT